MIVGTAIETSGQTGAFVGFFMPIQTRMRTALILDTHPWSVRFASSVRCRTHWRVTTVSAAQRCRLR